MEDIYVMDFENDEVDLDFNTVRLISGNNPEN
jgi:hypothetical protein